MARAMQSTYLKIIRILWMTHTQNRRNLMTNWKAKGNWNIIKGRLKQAYGALTDDDLKRMEGDMQEAVGIIQKRTGESREAIEKRLDELDREA
jgi:uncharacterized protein YjbJ (UPF0337 family)